MSERAARSGPRSRLGAGTDPDRPTALDPPLTVPDSPIRTPTPADRTPRPAAPLRPSEAPGGGR